MRAKFARVVPLEFEALRPIRNVPVDVGLPRMAESELLKVRPEGRSVTATDVASTAWN